MKINDLYNNWLICPIHKTKLLKTEDSLNKILITKADMYYKCNECLGNEYVLSYSFDGEFCNDTNGGYFVFFATIFNNNEEGIHSYVAYNILTHQLASSFIDNENISYEMNSSFELLRLYEKSSLFY